MYRDEALLSHVPLKIDRMSSFHILLATRLDWGFGNPNKTGALIAMLMVAAWILPFLHRRLFWLSLLVCTGLGVCLMQTASRGGILAALVGLAILIASAARSWPWTKIIVAGAAFWLVLGVAAWLPTLHRFSKGASGQDLSILSRLELWRAAPSMMLGAPDGWEFGRSADVFHQWYQPVGHTQLFTSLINSHLTWMVEMGWPGRFFYVLGWLSALALCWRRSSTGPEAKWMTVLFSVWMVFAITAWFNSVAESPWLWTLPAMSLGGCLWWRWRNKQWPKTWVWASLVLCSVGVIAGLVVIGLCSHPQPSLQLRGRAIIIGRDAQPAGWLLVNRSVLGNSYGQTLRKCLQAAPSFLSQPSMSLGLVNSLHDLPPSAIQARTLIVCGELDEQELVRLRVLLPDCSKLVLLNPTFFPETLVINSSDKQKVAVVAGEFSQAPVSSWTEVVHTAPTSVLGAGDYLPQWPEIIANQLAKRTR